MTFVWVFCLSRSDVAARAIPVAKIGNRRPGLIHADNHQRVSTQIWRPQHQLVHTHVLRIALSVQKLSGTSLYTDASNMQFNAAMSMSSISNANLSADGTLHSDVELIGPAPVPGQVPAAPESESVQSVHDGFVLFSPSCGVSKGLIRVNDERPYLALAEEPVLHCWIRNAIDPLPNGIWRGWCLRTQQ